jgi:diguanylate cyclase (GGDEF)-like protein
MRFLDMWNPFTFVGYGIASKRQIAETVRELYNSRPHVTATLGVALASLSAAYSGALWTGISATLIVAVSLVFRIVIERRFAARGPGDLHPKWIRLYVFGAVLSGIGWGLSCAILLVGTSPNTQAITMAVAGAIAQGAAGRAYLMPGTALVNIALIVGQMSIGAYVQGNYIYIPAFFLFFIFLASFIMQMVKNRLSQLHAEQTADRLYQEITEKNELLRIANETLATKAYEDPLTGLANRRKFDLVIAETLADARQGASPVSLLLIDVDHFKSFNDTYGHQSGDECLQLLSKEICNAISSEGALVARYGGEEFVAILPGCDLAEAKIIAERARIAARLTSLETLPNAPPRQTISIGLVSWEAGPATTRETLLAAADTALYQAKKQGRNRVCVYSETADIGQAPSPLDAAHQA